MSSRLLIVESPTKARTIGRMLGKDYTIIASMGHIRDLPERTLGVDIANDFAPQYVDTERSGKIVRELKSAAKKADEIYLAPDPDREGEAIAWHLAEVLKDSVKKDFHRVTFHEITKSAISRALEEKTTINMNLVDAQQARRVLDRIVGYQVSPLLWMRVAKGISAGRVQSVALRLVVERERAITGFTPEEYWVFSLVFRTADGREFAARLFKIEGKDFTIADGAAAEKALQAICGGTPPEVRSVSRVERKRNAPPPFTTSTLQQTASNAFHFSATNTMRYAQQLYEGIDLGDGSSVGMITYMRTDSVTVAREAQEAALEFIRSNYGPQYAPARPNYFKNKAAAQEAHEAIRPTDVTRTPESVAAYLDADQLKLYTLIWRRFTASQMTPCIQQLTTVDVGVSGADGREYTFRATATVPVFAGFTQVFNDDSSRRKDESEEAALLGTLAEREPLAIAKIDKEQKFTEPPPRYTEATLIKELEENGIGRPSTYATILRTIQTREYVGRDQGKLFPTELGFQVTDFLVGNLPELFDVQFTAGMENKLDEVEAGEVKWTDMMADFYRKFAPWLDEAKHSDAPVPEKVKALLAALSGVAFAPAEKRGRKTFDDSKFLKSIGEDFAANGKITGKQYQVLLTLGAKYAGQLGALSGAPEELHADLQQAAVQNEEREKRQAESAVPEEMKEKYERLFAAFDKLTWEEPVKRRGRMYDDKKFFDSLKKQAIGGKLMSEKQAAALVKIAEKYQATLQDNEFVMQMLNVPAQSAADSAAVAEDAAKISVLLGELKNVTEWAPPGKRGRFTYDDKAFFESLSKQFAGSGKLSPKQLAALGKMAAKYRNGGVETSAAAAAEDAGKTAPAEKAASAADNAEIAGLFATLDKVTEWAPPVKRGRFTVDDKAFFTSLKRQHDGGKTLSEKQTAALHKLAEKYK